MSTRKQAAQVVDYWASWQEDTADEILASRQEETVDEILATLDLSDDRSQDVLTEQVGYLVDDADFLRKHAHNLRVNRRYDSF